MAKHKRNCFRREIHTGLYGQVAESVLNNVILYGRTYGSNLDSKSFILVETERGVDNEIMLSVFDDKYGINMSGTVFKIGYKNDAQIRLWLAGCVKGVAKLAIMNRCGHDLHKAEIKKVEGWTRTNVANLSMDLFNDTNIPAAAYYAVYETLKGRKTTESKFPDGVFASVVGEPFDPIRTELEIYMREAEEKIDTDKNAELYRLDKEFNVEYENLKMKYNGLRRAANDKAKAAKQALNDEVAATLNSAA